MASDRPVSSLRDVLASIGVNEPAMDLSGVPFGNHAHAIGLGIPVLETPFLRPFHALLVADDYGPATLVVGVGTLTPRQQMMVDLNRIMRAAAIRALGQREADKTKWGFSYAEIIGAA